MPEKKNFRDLHLAENIEALDCLAEAKFKPPKSVHVLCNSLNKLYKESQQDPFDQEKSYILVARFLKILKNLMKVDNFMNIRFHNEIRNAQLQYDELRPSLIQRYKQKEQISKKEHNKGAVTQKVSEKVENGAIFNTEFISCVELYRALLNKCNMLIVDARPQSDYEISHMKSFHDLNIINVPDHLIHSGLSANSLGMSLPEETRNIWERRDKFKVLVLVDWNSNSENFSSSKLEKLLISLIEWDLKHYSEKPVILNGGYVEWLQQFPTFSTDSSVIHNRINNDLDELLSLDDIIYPVDADGSMYIKSVDNDENQSENINSTREDLIKQSKEVVNEKNNIINKLIEEENKWKQYKDKNDVNEIKNLQEVEEKIEDLHKKLQEKNQEEVQIENNFDLFAGFDPSNETLKTDDIKEISSIHSEEDEKMKILDTISQQRMDELNKARALKPKSIESKPQLKNLTNGNARVANVVTPIITKQLTPTINRLTKPKTDNISFKEDGLQLSSGLVGLKNIRNTCYMNTVIQCLRNIPLIKKLFCSGRYASHIKRKSDAITLETAYIIRSLSSNVSNYITPQSFYDKVCALSPSYRLGAHEDCMEFFLFLLNHLIEDCSYDIDRPSILTPLQKAWYDQLNGKQSIFIQYFYHQIRIQQICYNCNKKTFKFETESTFMFPVPDHDFMLQDLMKEYLADYIIEDYCCNKCKRPVSNQKNICSYPDILVIVLKRYKQTVRNGVVDVVKNNSLVYFPENNFVLGKNTYRLYSIALHSGTMNSGHYTAACLVDNAWYKFNDEIVSPTNINDDMVRMKACAFFYCLVHRDSM